MSHNVAILITALSAKCSFKMAPRCRAEHALSIMPINNISIRRGRRRWRGNVSSRRVASRARVKIMVKTSVGTAIGQALKAESRYNGAYHFALTMSTASSKSSVSIWRLRIGIGGCGLLPI